MAFAPLFTNGAFLFHRPAGITAEIKTFSMLPILASINPYDKAPVKNLLLHGSKPVK